MLTRRNLAGNIVVNSRDIDDDANAEFQNENAEEFSKPNLLLFHTMSSSSELVSIPHALEYHLEVISNAAASEVDADQLSHVDSQTASKNNSLLEQTASSSSSSSSPSSSSSDKDPLLITNHEDPLLITNLASNIAFFLYILGFIILCTFSWVSPLIQFFVREPADATIILFPNIFAHVCLVVGVLCSTLFPFVCRQAQQLYREYLFKWEFVSSTFNYLVILAPRIMHVVRKITSKLSSIFPSFYARIHRIARTLDTVRRHTFLFLHMSAIVWICLGVGWIFRLPVYRSFRPMWKMIPSQDITEAFSAQQQHIYRSLSLSSSSASSFTGSSSSSSSTSTLTWKPRIAITTIAGGYLPETAAKVLSNFRSYAKLHDYTFIEGFEFYGSIDWRKWEPTLDTTSSLFLKVGKTKIAWCKFPLLWNLSHSFDFVMWLDMDAVVTNPSISLESILGLTDQDKPSAAIITKDSKEEMQKEMWIGEDVNHRPWSQVPLSPVGTVHAGVFVVRGSPWIQALIASLLREAVPEHMLAEQYAIDTAIFSPRDVTTKNLHASDRVVLMPYYAFDSCPNSFLWAERWMHGDFIAHNMGDAHKEARLQAYLSWMGGERMFLPLWTYFY